MEKNGMEIWRKTSIFLGSSIFSVSSWIFRLESYGSGTSHVKKLEIFGVTIWLTESKSSHQPKPSLRDFSIIQNKRRSSSNYIKNDRKLQKDQLVAIRFLCGYNQLKNLCPRIMFTFCISAFPLSPPLPIIPPSKVQSHPIVILTNWSSRIGP